MIRSESSATRRSWPRTIGLWAIELLLVVVIAGLIVATWMPAIVRHQDEKKATQVEKPK